MTIDTTTGICDWATPLAGPPDKKFPQRNSNRGVVCHSVEGWLPGAIAELNKPDRQASWHFTIAIDGSLYQHYPTWASCWASGNARANTSTIAIEAEGIAGKPLTDDQVTTALKLFDDIERACGITLTRGVTLWEHNEVALWETPNAGATACPSHRWDPVFEVLAAAGEPATATAPASTLTLDAVYAYVDDLNTAVKAFEARVLAALAALADGIDRAIEELKA